MKVIYGNNVNYVAPDGTACALGFFDGVHIGHQKLISVLKEYSNSHNMSSMVFTFDHHPMTVLDSARAPKLIIDNQSKIKIFEELGVDILYFSHVDRNFLGTSPGDFLKNVLVEQLNIKSITAGFNFSFGSGGCGNAEFLEDFGMKANMDINIVKPVYIDGMVVSSSAIRTFLSEGNISMANKMLGKPYSIHGKVIHGQERGRKMGFPTINLSLSEEMLKPKDGVYLTSVNFEGMQMVGITNVGTNPTFGGVSISIETFILYYSGNLYGKDVSISFYDRIRDEKTFENPEELMAQLDCDKKFAAGFCNKNDANVYK